MALCTGQRVHTGEIGEEFRRDLRLVFADSAESKCCNVSLALLGGATRSAAISDIVQRLREEGENKDVVELRVDDEPHAWEVTERLLSNPLSLEPSGLTWGNVDKVIALADKYQLVPVLQAVESFILSHVAANPKVYAPFRGDTTRASPFGHLFLDGVRVDLKLTLLGSLCRVQLHRAAQALVPLYVRTLQDACARLQGRHEYWKKQLVMFRRLGYNLSEWHASYVCDLRTHKSRARHEMRAVQSALDNASRSQDLEALISCPVWIRLTCEVLNVVGDLISATTTIQFTDT